MDIHLDTSWCPVCDKAILPKRFVVPVPTQTPTPEPVPQQQPAAIQQQQQRPASRAGKGNKSRFVGGGLLHGTGRIRPGGGLRRDNSSNNVNQQRSPQKQNVAVAAPATAVSSSAAPDAQLQRQRTVIDQGQTPLYCSDECRKRDLEWSLPSPPTPTVASHYFDDHHHTISIRPSSRRLGPHPFDLNPAQHSPPAPPPVPPNSLRVSATVSEAEQSDSSESGSGESYGSSAGSSAGRQEPVGLGPKVAMALRDAERRASASGLGSGSRSSDPVPPEVPPMPLHPHRASAPARKPGSKDAQQQAPFEGGIMIAGRKLREMFFPGPSSSQEKEKAKASEVMDVMDAPRGALGRGGEKEDRRGEREREREREEREREKRRVEESYNWKNVVYGAPSESSQAQLRRASAPVVVAQQQQQLTTSTMQSRTQSALELYSKVPLFSKSRRAGSNQSLSALPTISTSYSHSYASEFSRAREADTSTTAMTNDKETADATLSERDQRRRRRREEQRSRQRRSAQDIPSLLDSPLYEGKKLSTKAYEPRPIVPEGVEGRLVVPNVMLPPLSRRPVFHTGSRSRSGESPRVQLGALLDASSRVASAPVLGREMSDASEGRSGLGSVAEECCGGDSKGDGRAESRERERRERKERRAKCGRSAGGSMRSVSPGSTVGTGAGAGVNNVGMTATERRRFNMEHRTWSYDNLSGPKYETMPPVPIHQRRFEDIFIPDPLPSQSTAQPTTQSTSTSTQTTEPKQILIINPLNVRDHEISRREVREVMRRRGVYEGKEGWFVEKEWDVVAVPERKRLFLFAGKE